MKSFYNYSCGLYFAFVLNRANVGCSMLVQEITSVPSENINLEVDIRSDAFIAQTTSVNPSSGIGPLHL